MLTKRATCTPVTAGMYTVEWSGGEYLIWKHGNVWKIRRRGSFGVLRTLSATYGKETVIEWIEDNI